MVLKKFTPRIWISIIAFSWGIVATLMGLSQSYGSMIACRLLVGAFEAGLFPGMTVYLTMFYTKRELGLRIGYLFVCSALAGATRGLLAYAIGNMDGLAGLRGWRWIIIIEGIPTVVMAFLAFFFMENDAKTAHFFTERYKALINLRRHSEYGQTASAQAFGKADAFKAFKDWKVWGLCIAQFSITIMLDDKLSGHFYLNGYTDQGNRLLYLPSNYNRRYRQLVSRSSSTTHHPLLRNWCHLLVSQSLLYNSRPFESRHQSGNIRYVV